MKTLVATILEGLEQADPQDVGFSEEHLRAYRLANAAPELLEAAKEIVSMLETMYRIEGPHVKKLKAAIAKATERE